MAIVRTRLQGGVHNLGEAELQQGLPASPCFQGSPWAMAGMAGRKAAAVTAGCFFSFVTDNESSKGAIQLPNTPAQDGNLGQMIGAIENNGRDYGSYIRAGEFKWFNRETGLPTAQKGTVVLLHGSPTQSYSYRVVMAELADKGYHCYAHDWLGYGFSERPQPGCYFFLHWAHDDQMLQRKHTMRNWTNCWGSSRHLMD